VRARLLTSIALALAAAAARGQTVEITPVAGYRFGGGFATEIVTDSATSGVVDYEVEDAASLGAQLAFRVSRDGEIEVLYSRQGTRLETGGLFTGVPVFDLALETWHAGGNYLFGEEDARVRPYIGMGLGVTRLLPEPEGLEDETRFSASFAGGAKIWLGKRVGVRVEARGFFTFLESDSQSFCQTGQGCQVHAQGSDISQVEVRAGVVLRF
jgi:hypothetical protein